MIDIPIHKKNHPARKQCLCCKRKFTPNPHVGQRQKYCSNKKCQAKRLRLAKQAWLKKEENKKFRKAQQSRWRKSYESRIRFIQNEVSSQSLCRSLKEAGHYSYGSGYHQLLQDNG